MISFEESIRLVRIQERVRNATYHELAKDGHHKSGEGAVTLSFVLPPVVGDDRDPYWNIEVYSYLLCPDGRSKDFHGKTAAEAISKAEDEIERWCMPSEMEQFSQRTGMSAFDSEKGADTGAMSSESLADHIAELQLVLNEKRETASW